jgi:hypothetical protein
MLAPHGRAGRRSLYEQGMYLEECRRRRLRISVALCRTYTPIAPGPSHGLSTLQQSVAPHLEILCNSSSSPS